MSSWTEKAEKVGAEGHPNKVDGKIQYGTAGFRTKYVQAFPIFKKESENTLFEYLKTTGATSLTT